MATRTGHVCRPTFLSPAATLLLIAIALLVLSHPMEAQQAHLSTSLQMLPLPGYDATVTYDDAPNGIGLDAAGNLFVTDQSMGTITLVQRSGNSYFSSTLLQNLPGPNGIAVDSQGSLFITEAGQTNGVIKETSPGTPDTDSNYTPSMIPVSGLAQPAGIAVDLRGNLYIADPGNNRIVKMTPSGNAWLQSNVPSSSLSTPYGVAVDTGGNVFIADYGHKRVLKETPSGSAYTESTVDANTHDSPVGLAVDAAGDVFVLNFVDQQTAAVLRETPANGGYAQSTVAIPPSFDPVSIAVDGNGLYLAAPGLNMLARLKMGPPTFGDVQVATTSLPVSLVFAFDAAGVIGKPAVQTQGAIHLDFSDVGTGTCGTQGAGHVYSVGDICSVNALFTPAAAGARYGAAQLEDLAGNPVAQAYVVGVGDVAQTGFLPALSTTLDAGLAHPMGVTIDATGNIYVAESRTGRVYKETSAGSASRTIVAQGLAAPAAAAVDGAGIVYVAAADAIYREVPVAGGYTQSKIPVGANDLADIALDGQGNLYIISSSSGDVRKETLGVGGAYAESAIGSGISNPAGVTVDSDQNILVTDGRQGSVYKETLQADGSYAQSEVVTGLNHPGHIVAVGTSLFYVAVSGGNTIDQFVQQLGVPIGEPDGVYLAGLVVPAPSTPWGIALDKQENLYVTSNVGDGTLTRIDIADPPKVQFPNTRQGAVSAPQTVTMANVGNFTLAQGPPVTISSPFQFTSESTCNLRDAGILWAGASCLFSIDFAPKAHENYQGVVTVENTNFNQVYAKQTIPLSGLGVTSDTTRTTMRISPDAVKSGLGVNITVTVSDTTNAATVPEGAVTLTDALDDESTPLNGGVPITLSNGKAVLTMVAGAVGLHTVTAHYTGGDASFASSNYAASFTVQP